MSESVDFVKILSAKWK